MPTRKRVKSTITRSGARRLGGDYQDLIAFDVLIDWLEHSERYEWVRVEADDSGVLDDVVARKCDGTIVYRQVKFAVHPEQPDNLWTWEVLLKQETGAKSQKLHSLLQDWAESLWHVSTSGQRVDAALYSNRGAAYEIRQATDRMTPPCLILQEHPRRRASRSSRSWEMKNAPGYSFSNSISS